VSRSARSPALRRDPERAILGGVCAGAAERLGIDPILVRAGFALAAIVTAGLAVAVYLVAWIALPAGGPPPSGPGRSSQAGRASGLAAADWRIAAGVGLITLAGLLVLRELGIWWTDAVLWPLILAASGAALLWRQSRAMAEPEVEAEPTTTGPPAARHRTGVAALYRGGFGVALVLGAAVLFLSANDALGEVRQTALVAIAILFAVALILAPFLWRLGRNLASERTERIRSQERAELAAHLHDSVLQTLALMQKRAGDPRRVATLARRQERELRDWLYGERDREGETGLAAGLRRAAAEIEDAHGVAIEVVAVGDRPAGPRGDAMLAAAREALTNAAKFAGDAGTIAVYAELEADRAQVFVRDRGAGFDLAAVPADRRGVRESIIGRMSRNGGKADVHVTSGGGTEVELAIGPEEGQL
jgi:phage shock protein PspC (stress-responsive transcriptional regulator)